MASVSGKPSGRCSLISFFIRLGRWSAFHWFSGRSPKPTTNRVERLIQAAAADPKQIPGFYAALIEAELFVLTPETEVGPEGRRSLKANEPFNIATVEFNGLRWHPAFTAKERISTYLTEPESCLGAKARDLFALLPKSNFWLNPRSECQKPLPAEEIALIMNRKIFDIDFAGAAKPSN
jgi:SseB protein N-terminal domain